MKQVKKAVIPAAGFGTRFLPATKAIAKEMFPIVDTPALQYIVEEAIDSGITDILIILGKNKKSIEDHFDYSPEIENLLLKNNKNALYAKIRSITDKVNIYYARQKEMKGSGHALLAAETFVANEPFAVLFGDDVVYNPQNPCTGQLIKAYETTGKSIIGCQTTTPEQAIKYGVIDIGLTKGRYYECKSIIEKPAIQDLPSNLVSMGRFVLTPDIFDMIRQTQPSKNGEIYLTDSIQLLTKLSGVFAYDFEGKRYDTGDKVGYIQANIEYALRDQQLQPDLKAYLQELITTLD